MIVNSLKIVFLYVNYIFLKKLNFFGFKLCSTPLHGFYSECRLGFKKNFLKKPSGGHTGGTKSDFQ